MNKALRMSLKYIEETCPTLDNLSYVFCDKFDDKLRDIVDCDVLHEDIMKIFEYDLENFVSHIKGKVSEPLRQSHTEVCEELIIANDRCESLEDTCSVLREEIDKLRGEIDLLLHYIKYLEGLDDE